jgi:hypothetical protein
MQQRSFDLHDLHCFATTHTLKKKEDRFRSRCNFMEAIGPEGEKVQRHEHIRYPDTTSCLES